MKDLDYYFKSIYTTEYFLIISFLVFILTFFNLSNTLDTSTLLSAILQSLASLLAIITAFTLVAVQLSSQTYGSRILKMFLSPKQNKFFWLLVGLYILSMIICILILISTPMDTNTMKNMPLNLESSIKISFIVLLAFWCFISLPGFITDTIKRLQPERVINNLFMELKVVSANFEDINQYDDYLVPIVDIITVSIINGHIDTAKMGITKLNEYYSYLNETDKINRDNAEEILSYFLKHFKRASKTAMDSLDDVILKHIISNASNLGFFAIQKNINSFSIMVSYYDQLSKKIVERELEQSIEEIMNYFEEKFIGILIISAMKETSDFYKINYLLSLMGCSNRLWEYSLEKNKLTLIKKIDNRMYYIIKKLAGSGLISPINYEINFLTNFALSNMEKYPPILHCVIHKLATIFWELNREWKKPKTDKEFDGLKKVVLNITKSLSQIGFKSFEKDLYNFEFDYYIDAHLYKKQDVISWIIQDLTEIALKYLKEDIYTKYGFDKDEISQSIINCDIRYLEDIGLNLVNKDSNSVIEVINALGDIGYSKNLIKDENTALNVLESMRELCIGLVEHETKGTVSVSVKAVLFIGLFGIENDFSEIIVRSILTLKETISKIICNDKLEDDLLEILLTMEQFIFDIIEEDSLKEYLHLIMGLAEELNKKCPSSSSKIQMFESIKIIKSLLKERGMTDLFSELEDWEKSLSPYSSRRGSYYEFSEKGKRRSSR